MSVASQIFNDNIKAEYLKPSVLKDITSFINDRFACRLWGYRLQITAKIATAGATILSFLTGAFPNYTYGNYISGMLGIVAMTSHHLSTYSFNRSRESTDLLNTTLAGIGIDTKMMDGIPDDKDGNDDNEKDENQSTAYSKEVHTKLYRKKNDYTEEGKDIDVDIDVGIDVRSQIDEEQVKTERRPFGYKQAYDMNRNISENLTDIHTLTDSENLETVPISKMKISVLDDPNDVPSSYLEKSILGILPPSMVTIKSQDF
jgi:hypothetical protein